MAQSWLSVPIFGSWFWPDQTLRPGTYKIVSNAQISSDIGNGIVLPKGLVKTGQLNTDEGLSIRSFTFESPAADDPDMFPQDFTLTISVTPEGAEKIVYSISPLLTDIEIDLSEEVLPDIIPPPGPLLLIGVRGGLARLHPVTGQVLDADGNPVGGGGFSYEQVSPLATWTIPSTFGRLPNVDVYISGEQVDADIFATSTQVSIIFPAPTSGIAILT